VKVSDYIIEFLVSKHVVDMFGYPGGVICHIMDSVTKYRNKIRAHALYHEQACAFAACSYAQATHNLSVAFSTSGPGATNLVTGIANAFYDSIPVLFITGNVDTYASKGNMKIRQRGFQETDFVSIVRSITKYSVSVRSPEEIRYCLEKAYRLAVTGRPGPVVLDLPADIQRAEIDVNNLMPFEKETVSLNHNISLNDIVNLLKLSKRPCFLVGAAIKQSGNIDILRQLCERLNIPAVTSMPAIDFFPTGHRLNGGFIGANGHRYANFILSKSDLVIVVGSRLDLKQVGNTREKFAPNAKICRIDIDEGELAYKVHDNEISLCMDISVFLKTLQKHLDLDMIKLDNEIWVDVCNQLKGRLKNLDKNSYHDFISNFSNRLPDDINITVDTGQSGVWVPQSFVFKNHQTFFVSAGLGSMGYSLPAAIGAYYANKQPVVCFNGDAGIQMNIQELEYIAKEQLPIKVIVLNNFSLGMIRQFQEKNFNKNYYLTTLDSTYAVPDFERLAYAYDFRYFKITSPVEFDDEIIAGNSPVFIEVQFDCVTYLSPNFGSNRPLNDMEPLIDRGLYSELLEL
jgi:acetolactate synthase-1/2/3 large subunit